VDDLVPAIETAMNGGLYISPSVVQVTDKADKTVRK
jgi:DNA-binding NarL/FixJ family response regulator